MKTTPMANSGNQGGIRMWPSFDIASSIYNWANVGLICALVAGVISTVLIVWMGNVKEEYLRHDIATTRERAATLEKEAEEARAEQERIKVQLAWRRITSDQYASVVASLLGSKPMSIIVGHAANDPEAAVYSEDIAKMLEAAGLTVNRTGFISPQAEFGLILMGSKDDPDAIRILSAFEAAGISILLRPGAPFLTINVWNKPPPF
jgi:hypothetical protein